MGSVSRFGRLTKFSIKIRCQVAKSNFPEVKVKSKYQYTLRIILYIHSRLFSTFDQTSSPLYIRVYRYTVYVPFTPHYSTLISLLAPPPFSRTPSFLIHHLSPLFIIIHPWTHIPHPTSLILHFSLIHHPSPFSPRPSSLLVHLSPLFPYPNSNNVAKL